MTGHIKVKIIPMLCTNGSATKFRKPQTKPTISHERATVTTVRLSQCLKVISHFQRVFLPLLVPKTLGVVNGPTPWARKNMIQKQHLFDYIFGWIFYPATIGTAFSPPIEPRGLFPFRHKLSGRFHLPMASNSLLTRNQSVSGSNPALSSNSTLK